MNTLSRSLLALAFVAATAVTVQQAQAQNPITFTYTGEITSVDDQYNWFNNTYAVGATVSGTITYFDSGYTKAVYSGYPATDGYEFGLNSSVLHPDFSLKAGSRQVNQEGNRFSAIVTNDGPAPVQNNVGDTIEFQPSVYTLPTFFNDPANTPGFEDYYATPFVNFKLYDPTGTALSSTGLPLTAPDLSAFSSRIGRIGIEDGNGSYEDFALAQFRLTSLQAAVPEPGNLALLLGVGVSGGLFALRRRRK